MDKEIIKILMAYDFTDNEIEDIKNIAPMIDVISGDEFLLNCELLANYGYPADDMDVLLLANPNIFVRSKTDLENDLKKLKSEYGDIEEVLKSNPYII